MVFRVNIMTYILFPTAICTPYSPSPPPPWQKPTITFYYIIQQISSVSEQIFCFVLLLIPKLLFLTSDELMSLRISPFPSVFLVMNHSQLLMYYGLQDLNLPTKDQTRAPKKQKPRNLTMDPQGISCYSKFGWNTPHCRQEAIPKLILVHGRKR